MMALLAFGGYMTYGTRVAAARTSGCHVLQETVPCRCTQPCAKPENYPASVIFQRLAISGISHFRIETRDRSKLPRR